MIERFNFFDVYGYLLPGGLLMVLTWLPFGLISGRWPSADWPETVAAAGVAYIIGHLLRALSKAAFPEKFADKNGNLRYPSDLLVDERDDHVLPTHKLGSLKYVIAEKIGERFGIDIMISAHWSPELGLDRNVAFLKCRSVLTKANAAKYAEQQQGMYELTRGVGAAFMLAVFLYAGVSLGILLQLTNRIGDAEIAFGIALLVLIGLAIKRISASAAKETFWIVGWMFLVTGTIIIDAPMAGAGGSPEILSGAFVAVAMAGLSWVFSSVSLFEFRGYAISFASTVYRDFSNLIPEPPEEEPGDQGEEGVI